MTTKQKRKIKAIIRKDAQVDGYYYRSGQTCVIGGLLLKAGFTVDDLQSMDRDDCSTRIGRFRKACKTLRQAYGLIGRQASKLQSINDDHIHVPERRKALLAAVERFA